MSTNLSGNVLTLGNTGLNEETLKAVKSYYYVPDNCKAGDTVILDGIECLCVATGVTIQGSNLTRIAVDKNHDLGYYQKYVGINQNNIVINQIKFWIWGGYGTALGNTSQEVGYGLQNTVNCLANKVNYTNGNNTDPPNIGYPWLWQGVNDFRSSHSDKWFVPSLNELANYIYPYKSSLVFDSINGGNANASFWSSSEDTKNNSYYFSFSNAKSYSYPKLYNYTVRLCRAF